MSRLQDRHVGCNSGLRRGLALLCGLIFPLALLWREGDRIANAMAAEGVAKGGKLVAPPLESMGPGKTDRRGLFLRHRGPSRLLTRSFWAVEVTPTA